MPDAKQQARRPPWLHTRWSGYTVRYGSHTVIHARRIASEAEVGHDTEAAG